MPYNGHSRDNLRQRDQASASGKQYMPSRVALEAHEIRFVGGQWQLGRVREIEGGPTLPVDDPRRKGGGPKPNHGNAPATTVSTEAISRMLICRFQYGWSLQKLADSLDRAGVPISRSALSRIVHGAAVSLSPIATQIRAIAMEKQLVSIACASVKDHIGGSRRLWVYRATDLETIRDAAPKSVCWIKLTPDRIGGYARKELGGYRGLIQAAGPGGDNPVGLTPDEHSVLCWNSVAQRAHMMRIRHDAPILTDILSAIEVLRQVERDTAEASANERYAARQERSAPVITELQGAINSFLSASASRSIVTVWLTDLLSHWRGLTLFLAQSGIPLENAAAPILDRLRYNETWHIGRSAHAPDELWSVLTVFENCRSAGVDLQAYLPRALRTLQSEGGAGDIDATLPWHFAG